MAAQSHAYNLRQRRFAQLFPEYLGPIARDLPNMSRPASVSTDTGNQAAKPTQKPAAAPSEEPPRPEDDARPAPPPSSSRHTPPPPRTTSRRFILWVLGAVVGAFFVSKVIEKLAM